MLVPKKGQHVHCVWSSCCHSVSDSENTVHDPTFTHGKGVHSDNRWSNTKSSRLKPFLLLPKTHLLFFLKRKLALPTENEM